MSLFSQPYPEIQGFPRRVPALQGKTTTLSFTLPFRLSYVRLRFQKASTPRPKSPDQIRAMCVKWRAHLVSFVLFVASAS